MNKEERIKLKMEKDPDIIKYLKGNYVRSIDQLYLEVRAYIKAIKEKRMVCVIDKVSASGMSRTMMFYSCEKHKYGHHFDHYYSLFKAYGHSFRGNSNYATIGGCGMDMVFSTNYNMIHWFRSLGFISKKQCSILAQKTPTHL